MSIVDAIGSYVLEGDTRNHFNILNEPDYYNLNLSEDHLRLLYKHHRCLLNHNARLSYRIGLSIETDESNVIKERKEGLEDKLYLNLRPFLILTEKVIEKFFNKDKDNNIIENSNQSKKC